MIAAALTDPTVGATLEALAAEVLGARPGAVSRQRRRAPRPASALLQPLAERAARAAGGGAISPPLFDEVEMPLVRVLARWSGAACWSTSSTCAA